MTDGYKLDTLVAWLPEGHDNLQFEVQNRHGVVNHLHMHWLTERIYSLQNELSELIGLLDAVWDNAKSPPTTNPNAKEPELPHVEDTLGDISDDEKVQKIKEKQAKNKEKLDGIL